MSSTDLDSHVYVGLWTNWSRGSIMGATLTLTREHGNLLIAFTASFVAFVAIHFWHIVCLACHRSYSTSSPRARPVLHQQRQIILRNSANPESAVLSLLLLLSAWFGSYRGHYSRLVKSIAPVFCLAVVTWTAFTAAGGFSSKVASVGHTVLLAPDTCGYPSPSIDESSYDFWRAELAASVSSAANYAQQCYTQATSSGTVDCGRFIRPSIPWTADSRAACPFNETMCRSSDRNLRLDTGLLDWTTNLGVNAPPDQRLLVRAVWQCAPLNTEGFRSVLTDANGTVVRYHYGSLIDPLGPNTTVDYIHQGPDVATQYRLERPAGLESPAGLNFRLLQSNAMTRGHEPALLPGSFVPLPELFRPDGDLTVVFLSGNGIVFDEPWPDPWYRGTASSKSLTKASQAVSQGFFQPDEAASPLGCVEQWQFCSTSTSTTSSSTKGGQNCSTLSSIGDALGSAAPIFDTTTAVLQSSADTLRPPDPDTISPAGLRLWWMSTLWSANSIGMGAVINFLNSKALATQAALFGGVQYAYNKQEGGGGEGDGDDDEDPDPPPIWHADVTNWFGTALSALQGAFVYAPLGPRTRAAASSAYVEISAATYPDLCHAQLVRTSAYTSFSMFGLCFTYALGGLVVVVSLALEPLLGLCYRRWGFQGYRQLEWTMGGSLQLLRLAQEEVGYGGGGAGGGGGRGEEKAGWERCDQEVPVTGERDALLGELDVSNPAHPIIMRRCEAEGRVEEDEGQKAEGPSSGEQSRVEQDEDEEDDQEDRVASPEAARTPSPSASSRT